MVTEFVQLFLVLYVAAALTLTAVLCCGADISTRDRHSRHMAPRAAE